MTPEEINKQAEIARAGSRERYMEREFVKKQLKKYKDIIRSQEKKIAEQDKLLDALAHALKRHHEWQVNNPMEDKEYGFGYAAEYGDSTLCMLAITALQRYQALQHNEDKQ